MAINKIPLSALRGQPDGLAGLDAEGLVEQFGADAVDVRRWGAVGDGESDDTAHVVEANAASRVLLFPAGFVCRLQNWEPLAGTVILAHGATIQRHGDATFGDTGSSAALVVSNDDITILGGDWTDAEVSEPAWSGAIVINGGHRLRVQGASFFDTWGAIFGHEAQNGELMSQDVSICDCVFRGNAHNTYLADINRLTFARNSSSLSDRDGLRTYRNCVNIIIAHNHLFDNGNDTEGQSRDGMDLFFAGERCVVTGNIIYGNASLGIDIKSTPASTEGETYLDREYIISGNFIFGNADRGIRINNSDGTAPVDHILVSDNHVFDNGGMGICLSGTRHAQVRGNLIYDNGDTGIHLEDSEHALATANTVYGNADVGISIDDGLCHDNLVYGHVTDYTTAGSSTVRGKRVEAVFAVQTGAQLVGAMPHGSVSAVEAIFNGAVTSAGMVLTRRDLLDGTADGALVSQTVSAAGYVTQSVAVESGSVRHFAGGEGLSLSLSNITAAATTGRVVVHYID